MVNKLLLAGVKLMSYNQDFLTVFVDHSLKTKNGYKNLKQQVI